MGLYVRADLHPSDGSGHVRTLLRRALAAGALLAAFFAVQPGAAQEFFTLKGHGGPIKGIATGRDGTILTASFDNSVGLWRNGRATWLEGHEAAVNAVVYLGDGRAISAGDDFALRYWDSEAGTSREMGRHDGKVLRLALSPDARRVASASWDGTARIWSLDSVDAPPVELSGHQGGVNDVRFSPDGARVYTASSDGSLRVWNASDGTPQRVLVQHGFGINALVIAEDESWIAYGAVDGGTRVLSLPDGQVLGDFTLDRRPILALAYRPGTERVAVGDAHGFIMLIDTRAWAIADDFRATGSGPVWALDFSPDGANLHAGGLDSAMYSWPVSGFGSGAQMLTTAPAYLTPPEEMSNGERQFQRKCSICHSLTPDTQRRAGPTLHGVFGRRAGTVAGYPYSPTLSQSDIVWDAQSIERLFDLGPDHFIPGSKMPMQRITAADDRADLIAYLERATRP